jgi:hypothetical protein
MTVVVCVAIAGWLDTPAKANVKIARLIEVPAPPPPLHLIRGAE